MNTILVSQMQDGFYVTDEAYLDEKYIVLTPDIPVSEGLVERLKAWKFDGLLSNGEITKEPPKQTLAAQSTDSAPLAAVDSGRQDTRQMEKARKEYQEFLRFVERLFGNFLTNGEIPQTPVTERAKRLMELVKEQRPYLLRLNEFHYPNVNYVVDHSVKTAIIAAGTALTMRMPPHKVIDIGVTAFLHEIGMIRLPSQLYMTNRELSPKERKAITTHTVLGFKLLRQQSYPMSICLGILECREHVDGSGYPRGLSGDSISINGKIINVASSYAAMVSARPYRPAIDGHNALLTLLKGRGTRYEEESLRALVATISLYPFGTYVQLSNGHRGIVVDCDPRKPRTPTVRLLTDETGAVITDQPLVATDQERYQIRGVLSTDEATKLKSLLEE